MAIIIADSGSTNCEWIIVENNKKKRIVTNGLSPYFLTKAEIIEIINKQVKSKVKDAVTHIYFYGTGLGNKENATIINKVLKAIFKDAKIDVQTDLVAAARGLFKQDKGVVCILGTGSNCGFYNGKKIIKTNPGLGFILGDEGSGSYLGKKVLQYYLYNTFDDELKYLFENTFKTNREEILNKVYKQPQANKYIASFTSFLSQNRGHFMIENIIEDGLHDFIFHHIYKFKESWNNKISFTGSIAFVFKDVLENLCNSYELEVGTITKTPMEGLIKFHSVNN